MLKIRKEVRVEVFQLLCRHTIDDGSTTGANSSLIHTPSVANRIQLLFVTMAAGIADRINGSESCRATSALQSSTYADG